MQRIIVKNFGPLKNIDLEIKDFMVIIGPNASGKSTLTKLIYLIYRSFGDFIYSNNSLLFNPISDIIVENIKEEFLEFSNSDYYLKIITEKGLHLELDNSYGESKPQYSHEFDIVANYKASETKDSDYTAFAYDDKIEYLDFVKRTIGDEFLLGNLFIPSNRRIIFNNPEYFAWTSSSSLAEKLYFNNVTSYFRSLSINSPKRTSNKIVDKFKQLSEEVVHGTITSTNKGSFNSIESKEGWKVEISKASSGQQELLPIIALLTQSLESDRFNRFFIEEPEAHVFPSAQRKLFKLITIFFNSDKKRKILINTHSHYILGALNVLINAHRIGQQFPEKVEQVVEKEFWIDKERVFAGYLENGVIHDIYDEEADMYGIDEITSVATKLNDEFDALIDLEFENEEV